MGTSPVESLEGRQIGPYRVSRKLGGGGMGVVYLAEDVRLGRWVALKALAPEFTRDEGRRERLRREARAAAALSHPAIATVYALEEIGDDLYIAGEYVDGQTLRAELAEGPLPLREALGTGSEIVRALAAAHAQGIVHRDLKPENVMRRADGGIKVLDFGLARYEAPSPASDARSTRLTAAGMIVGTPAYMSPEQLQGQNVDFRSDIFSFGVLLYELITGTHPFEAPDPASTIGRILETEPSALAGQSSLSPAEVHRIVRKCLRKRADERYQSTRDLAVDLEQLRRDLERGDERTAGVDGAAIGAPPASAMFTPRWWWRFHQTSVTVLYGLVLYPMWLIKESIEGTWTVALFLAMVTCAAVGGSLRAHLLFTDRVHPDAVVAQLRRAGPWLRRADWVFCLLLVAAAGTIASTRAVMAAVLVAVAVGGIVTFLMIEPATTRAAFPRRSSGVRRKTS